MHTIPCSGTCSRWALRPCWPSWRHVSRSHSCGDVHQGCPCHWTGMRPGVWSQDEGWWSPRTCWGPVKEYGKKKMLGEDSMGERECMLHSLHVHFWTRTRTKTQIFWNFAQFHDLHVASSHTLLLFWTLKFSGRKFLQLFSHPQIFSILKIYDTTCTCVPLCISQLVSVILYT